MLYSRVRALREKVAEQFESVQTNRLVLRRKELEHHSTKTTTNVNSAGIKRSACSCSIKAAFNSLGPLFAVETRNHGGGVSRHEVGDEHEHVGDVLILSRNIIKCKKKQRKCCDVVTSSDELHGRS